MKYRLMDLLACPICKSFPLQLIVFNEVNMSSSDSNIKSCDEYCSYYGKKMVDLKNEGASPDCKSCLQIQIVNGIITCQNCDRWYPIIEEIPHMLPDELRNEKEDKAFLIKNKEKIPQAILGRGRPFNLSHPITE
ncbi:MAG: Trm112 family protein [Nitrososphaerales archaeon]|nr:Trm112 family protein [Nitrososphaerales archaeon]